MIEDDVDNLTFKVNVLIFIGFFFILILFGIGLAFANRTENIEASIKAITPEQNQKILDTIQEQECNNRPKLLHPARISKNGLCGPRCAHGRGSGLLIKNFGDEDICRIDLYREESSGWEIMPIPLDGRLSLGEYGATTIEPGEWTLVITDCENQLLHNEIFEAQEGETYRVITDFNGF